MKLAIMQPYFFPYLGYFQLMNAVDEFIIYDNIQFSKQGWVNRNRILKDGRDTYITLPLKKDSDYLDINDRYLASNWLNERKKILNRIAALYKKAPFFNLCFPIIEQCLLFEETNLFRFIYNSLFVLREFFELQTLLIKSSDIKIDHSLRGEMKVIAICKARSAETYLNAIGGLELYDKKNFREVGITLQFLQSNNFIYNQFDKAFVPSLSIIDLMMFNPKERIIQFMNNEFTLI